MNSKGKTGIRELYHEVEKASWIGLFVNLTLGAIKLIGGILGSSFALIADAVNSLGDAITTVVVLISLRVAQKPADDEHPYGHTRAESIAALTVSTLIIVSAVVLGWEAAKRITENHPIPAFWTLVIAGANLVIKEALFQYKMSVARRTGSTAMIANAWDHRSDAMCSLAVLIGIGIVRIGGPRAIGADEIASLIVVAIIIWTGTKLFRQASSELMDLQADLPFVETVRSIAGRTPGVKEIEKLWVRKSGLECFVEIHLQVDSQMTVEQGHRIGHEVKQDILEQVPSVRDVLVHLEPHPHVNPSKEKAISG